METQSKPFQDATLDGPTCALLPFSELMISDDYVRWLNTPDVNRFLEVRHVSQSRELVIDFVRGNYHDPMRYLWGVRLKASARLVGTATLYRNLERSSGEVGLMIGETDAWGKGVSDELIDLVAQFAFGQIGLRRLTGGTYATNAGINFTLRRLGFKLEGVLRKCRQAEDGSFVDEFLWGVLAEEWKIRHLLKLTEAATS